MIAHSENHAGGPDHDALCALLDNLTTGLEHDDLELVLGCFHSHAVLHAPDESIPLEGIGSLRTYFRRRIRSQRFSAVPRILGIDFGAQDRAILRAQIDAPSSDDLVFALCRTSGRWVITHCRWTRAAESKTSAA